MESKESETLANLKSCCEGFRFLRGGHPREFDSMPTLTPEQKHREWCRARFIQILHQRRVLKWKFKQIGDFFEITASRAGDIHRQAERWEKMGLLKEKPRFKEPIRGGIRPKTSAKL